MSVESNKAFSTKKKVFVAYYWNMLGKLIVRSLGVVSTLILVRLLDPQDFGLVAIGMMLIGFFEVLSDAGINRYLILHPSPTDDDYNGAWTLNICFRFALLAILALLAPQAALLFENPNLVIVIYFMCLTQVIFSFRNIGMVKLEKQINYKTENKVLVTSKLVSFVVVLVCAFYLRNYFALLLATLVNVVTNVIGSYLVISYRPKLNFNFSSDMFSFSKFLLLRNVLSYSRSQMDILLVSKRFGDIATGQFSVARRFSVMPQSELIVPAMRPVFSGLSKFKEQPDKLLDNSLGLLFISYVLVFPCAFGLFAIAKPFTDLVLGEKWAEVSEFIGVLSFLMIIYVTQPILNIIYDMKGKVNCSFWADIFSIAILLFGFIALNIESVREFAQFRLVVAGITLCSMLMLAKYFVEVPILRFLNAMLLPVLSSCIMYFCIKALPLDASGSLTILLSSLAFGAAVYSFFFWLGLFIVNRYRLNSDLTKVIQLLPAKYWKFLGLRHL